MKKYVLFAGVNGAGKSTLFLTLESLKQIERVNIDEIVRSFGDWKNPSDVVKAGKIAVTMINDFFERGVSFNQETTLCGGSILKNIARAKALGYEIELHYVGLESVEIAKARIAHRVEHGGHGIPDADVERRYFESFEHLNKVLCECNIAVLYDNTDAFKRFAIYKNGVLFSRTDEVPEWYKKHIRQDDMV